MHNHLERCLFIISGVLAVLSIGLSLYAHWAPLFPGDLVLILWLQSFASPLLTRVMFWISWIFGGWYAAIMVVPAVILTWWLLGGLPGITVLAAGVISPINDAFKLAINRPRPTPEQVNIIGTNHGSGFPSGHTFFATIFLGILAYLLFTRLKSRSLRGLSLMVLILLAFLVGISRIYLGAHWPSDVLGGYVIGGFVLVLLIIGYKSARKATR